MIDHLDGSEEDLAVIALLLDDGKKVRKNKQKRIRVHGLCFILFPKKLQISYAVCTVRVFWI